MLQQIEVKVHTRLQYNFYWLFNKSIKIITNTLNK